MMDEAIKIAQFIKNCCGNILIISSACVNCQFSLPGKNILWNITNAFSKLMETKPIKMMNSAKIDMAEVNATCIPNGRQKFTFFFLSKTKRTMTTAKDKISTIVSSINKTLQSAKCALPSGV